MSPNTFKENEAVRLEFYQLEHKAILETFYLPKEQNKYTSVPKEKLAIAVEDKHQYPIVILTGSKPVGFFILYDGENSSTYTNNSNSLILRSFSINHADQGNGYAKKGLLLLKDFIKEYFPLVGEVVLAVNAQNVLAKSLYLKCGFKENGSTMMGPIGLQHILSFSV